MPPSPQPSYAAPASPDRLEGLLQAVAVGERQALRALYDLTATKLFGLALRITGRRDWAEDVVQESFVSIWHHAGDYRPQLAAPMTWMTAIVRNRALDCLRRAAAARVPQTAELDEDLGEWLADDAAGPAELAEASQQARALNRCLQRLEQPQRQAIMLAYLQDLSHAELAERLRAPLGTVKSWIRRGLERLRSCMEGTA
ncbi:sigma-70 family RNA polymerase sigma factor [Cupriavidus taiwanensis]|uniref:RNA polymerase sigma factor, sigma-24 n=1 Tax=Cupriavidus taiwanensis TaxID=164546 RepID=A0A7Z7JC01_9BURK|nr:sigma-70 family RNA polymerase sigma factor [Cupriavidus taiwanensis]SOY49496.1 RNA polymerase sigma factor, sigma-24 [Cupriavidus taiwanensis]SOY88894.1 RNA polymerase sigma factor, sigma-24 [Cupriavidus taiwanensis]SOZ02984.1 RNA polymerase sigma factor, sigma-24 [Cupriavidus taiwanensis]SOZ06259.1 RNA polymerase sigma factor, sigma-24 [Cupriavidus taiwanensis]SPC18790.1 RNA polymerase sigma factor, sigma-24 [Cupriavidus taiwanensis]